MTLLETLKIWNAEHPERDRDYTGSVYGIMRKGKIPVFLVFNLKGGFNFKRYIDNPLKGSAFWFARTADKVASELTKKHGIKYSAVKLRDAVNSTISRLEREQQRSV